MKKSNKKKIRRFFVSTQKVAVESNKGGVSDKNGLKEIFLSVKHQNKKRATSE